MEIIKEGSRDKAQGIKQFECEKCGCIFKVTSKEYRICSDFREGNSWYEVTCPSEFCHKTIIKVDE